MIDKNKTTVLDASLVKTSLECHQRLMDVKDNKKSPENNNLQVKFKTAHLITDGKNTPKM
jgi:hypothetical protein